MLLPLNARQMDAVAWWTEAALTTFFIAAIGVVIFRCQSKSFAAMTAYGGRSAPVRIVASSPRAPSVRDVFSIRLSRRASFQSFYCAGVLALPLAAFPINSAYGTTCLVKLWVTPVLFASHCLLRLVESTWRQHYRLDDTVTFFSMCSGSGFYVAAMLSAVPWSLLAEDRVQECYDLRRIALLAAVHMILQAVQVYHHEILRGLRASSPQQPTVVVPSSHSADCEYVFPVNRAGFSFVQEPHYFCEVMLYATQWALLATIHGGQHWAAALVGVFSLCNLTVTAHEHREYWRRTTFSQQIPRHLIIPGVL
jgi:hypothetical protein